MASPMVLLTQMKCQDSFFSWLQPSRNDFRHNSEEETDKFQVTRRLENKCKKKAWTVHFRSVLFSTRSINTKAD
jgi:hypothetical protein